MSGATAASVPLRLQIGARTLVSIRRRLVTVSPPLEAIVAGAMPTLPALPRDADGWSIRSLPEPLLAALDPAYRPFVRQHYPRHYADLTIGYDAYLKRFSSKTRSTLARKSRRLAERSGGALDVRAYARPEEMAAFHRDARAISAASYQERLLDAGLPDGPEALAALTAAAAADRVRGFVLFVDGAPVSYLHLPAMGDTLLYAHLGYRPEWAEWSAGGVLQMEAMRRLMDEGRFARFDFTEGDGQHKRLFATASVPCADVLLLRPTLLNAAATATIAGFDGAVAWAKRSPTLRRIGSAVGR